jgi:hypothetical protein
MQNISLPPTDRSPLIEFDFEQGRFLIKGESYPEDTARFFGPLLNALREFVAGTTQHAVVCDIELQYFNSSSAKALMNLFQLLEAAAESGRKVTINWHFAADDEAMQEFGEDFAQDVSACQFNLRQDTAA